VRSRNLVSIRLLRSIGPDAVIDYAARFGFEPSAMPRNLTLALGTLPATPLEVATGFATFANGGFRVKPYFIDRIENAGRRALARAAPGSPATAARPCRHRARAAAQRLVRVIGAGRRAAAWDPPPSATWAAGAAAVGRHGIAAIRPGAADHLRRQLLDPDDMMADVIRRGTGRRALALGRNDPLGQDRTTTKPATPGSTVSTRTSLPRSGSASTRNARWARASARTAGADLGALHAQALRTVRTGRASAAGLVQLAVGAHRAAGGAGRSGHAAGASWQASCRRSPAARGGRSAGAASAPRRGTDTTESGESIF
jgi:hypothetical protein